MTAAQLHLLVNHVPVLGAIFGTLLIAAGYWITGWRTAGLALLVVAGIGAIAADVSGEESEHAVEEMPDRDHDALHAHEELAEKTTPLLVVTGLFAIGALVGRESTWGRRLTVVALVGGLAGSALGYRTAHLGGLISHPEAAGEQPPGNDV